MNNTGLRLRVLNEILFCIECASPQKVIDFANREVTLACHHSRRMFTSEIVALER